MPDQPRSAEPSEILQSLLERLNSTVVGQPELLTRLVVSLLAGGHVLIEGPPGLAKTRAVQSLAHELGLPFRRIQFTPDLLPADLTGTQVYHPATGNFNVRQGPIVTHVLLADEINRAPAKVQSALLEAMQEGQVTIGNETVKLPDPFYVLATQNPIEHEGTYPLPEAQLDRFLMKLLVTYPNRAAELDMLDLPDLIGGNQPITPLLDADQVRLYKQYASMTHVADLIKGYIVDLVRATRVPDQYGLAELKPLIELGASPRASIGLVRSAQAHALLAGRNFVTPHDVKSIAQDVLRHRLILSYEADAQSLAPDDILEKILDHMPVP